MENWLAFYFWVLQFRAVILRNESEAQVRSNRLFDYLTLPRRSSSPPSRPIIGVLKGTGVGPEVIGCSLQVLAAVQECTGIEFELWHGAPIGEEAKVAFGKWLPVTTIQFCAKVFERGGAILSGPGAGRYVYDLRKQFDLFCKFV